MKIQNGNTPIQLPEIIRAGDPITARWANTIRGAIQRLRDRTPTSTGTAKKFGKIKPPFWASIRKNSDDDYVLTMQDGYVILRLNSSLDAMRTILPTDIPEQEVVVVGDKFTLQIDEDTRGEFSTAAIVKTSGDWPTSTAPDLDAETTSGGVRHIRICEVIEDEDDNVRVKIWSTGHVDHFAPTIIKNVDTSGANVLKEYTDGEWRLRTITAGAGIEVNEDENSIEIVNTGGTGDHMWKTTVNDPVEFTYDVLGGVVSVQGSTEEIADEIALEGAENGFVLLKVTRDEASRALDGVPIIVWANTLPANHASTPDEYYILAEVIDGVVRQHRFQEIISYELMIVANGEFKLGPFLMLTRDVYDPPV
jgi:hypothetical protein